MKARQIEYGGLTQVGPGVWAERVTSRYYKKCWGERLDPKYIAFCVPAPNDKLAWWIVEADAEVNRVGSTKDLSSNN